MNDSGQRQGASARRSHHARRARSGPAALALLACVALAACVACVACDEEAARAPRPVAGLTVARSFLFPYSFDAQHTLYGLDVLDRYVREAPQSRDIDVARWLILRTQLDMYTHAVAMRAVEPQAGAALLARLAVDLDLPAGEADDASIVEALEARLGALEVRPSLREALDSALALLEAQRTLDFARHGQLLEELAASASDMAYNARVLIASRALDTLRALPEVESARLPEFLAARYPYPCPEGFAAFAAGDPSLEACEFVCSSARERYDAAPPPARRETLMRLCDIGHFGLSHHRDAALVSRENYVLIQTLRHMAANHLALDRTRKRTHLGILHEDFIAHYAERLRQVLLPVRPPLMDVVQASLTLPALPARHVPHHLPRQTVTLTPEAIHVSAAAHFRLDRDEVIVPESRMGYVYPGREALRFPSPLTPDALQVRAGELTRLRTMIEDLEDDHTKLEALAGAHAVGRVMLVDDPLLDPAQRLTRLVIDARAGAPLIASVLRTLRAFSFRPFELLTWNPQTQRPSALLFDARLEPAPAPATLITLSRDGWRLQAPGQTPREAQARDAPPDQAPLLTTLARLNHALLDAPRPLFVTLRPDLDAQTLAVALEVLSHRRQAPADASLDALLDAPLVTPEAPPVYSERAQRAPDVVLLLGPP